MSICLTMNLAMKIMGAVKDFVDNQIWALEAVEGTGDMVFVGGEEAGGLVTVDTWTVGVGTVDIVDEEETYERLI